MATRSESVGGVDRVDDGAERLAHPLSIHRHETVAKYVAGERQLGRHQHRGPDDGMKARDVLADHVQVGGPPAFEHFLVRAEADGRRVIDERIEPHIDDTGGIERQRNAPRLPRAADGDVGQPAFDETQDLVPADVRLQKMRMRREMVEERLLVFRKPEEMVLLADPFGLDRRVQLAIAVDEILLLLELFATDAVPAFVDAFVDVAGAVNPPRQIGHSGLVPRLRGPDEIVERDVEAPPRLPELRLHTIAVRERIQPLFGGLFEHVLRVLVVPHEEACVEPAKAFVSRDHVGAHLLVRGPEVRPAVDIVDCRREEEALHGREP